MRHQTNAERSSGSEGPRTGSRGAAALLDEAAVIARKVRLRAGQSLPLCNYDPRTLYLVAEGVAVLRAEWRGCSRHAFALLLPGEAGMMRSIPPGEEIALVAMQPATLLMIPPASHERMSERERRVRDWLIERVADGQARSALHDVMISVQTAEQRVATFLVDLALRRESAPGAATVLELPLSRSELAEYLALNADTLSRVMSHLRGQGLFAQPRRSRIVFRDWPALTALSPMTAALQALSQRRDGLPAPLPAASASV